VLVTAAALAVRDAQRRSIVAELSRPRDLHGTAHVGSAACQTCHPDNAASWHRTFHRTMTQDVGPNHPDAVAGDFANASYTYLGVTARMHRDGDGRYLMTFSDARGGPPVDAEVVRSVGSRRYQQYLTQVAGALWRLPLAYHIEERRWFPMNGAFLTPEPAAGELAEAPVDPPGSTRPRFGGGAFDRHVTRWNDNCVFCHNVAPNPGRDVATGQFRSTVAELGVACEACHGPGDAHVRANASSMRRSLLRESGDADPTIVNPLRLSPARAADLCGRCHGQRMADDVAPFLSHGDPFVPGDDLSLYSSPLWRDTPQGNDRTAFAARFWDDGTPRLTAYEYQGLLESRCAQQGALTCTSCHTMHDGDPRGQIRPIAAGDRACTSCHTSLTGTAAVAAHTRHDPAGPGGRCVGCHMPRIVYGVLDIHVSHRIEVPEPSRAMAMGRPDACTLCHVDADRAWAARERARLWPASAAPGRPLDDHLGPTDALYAGDPIVRAVAADALGRAPSAAGKTTRRDGDALRAGLLLQAMEGDRYPAVRHLAARALARVVGDPVARQARAFDATATAPVREQALAALRAALPRTALHPIDPRRLARLRAEARQVDIDIGE